MAIIIQNITARNRHTAMLTGEFPPGYTGVALTASQATEALNGWVYKQPGMTTLGQCIKVVEEVRQACGDKVVAKLLKRHNCVKVQDIWPGMWEAFHKDATELLGNSQTRWLLFHPESDCVFEVLDRDGAMECLNDGLVHEVTGDPSFESRFKAEQQGNTL